MMYIATHRMLLTLALLGTFILVGGTDATEKSGSFGFDGGWQYLGPDGGNIYTVQQSPVDPDLLFAGQFWSLDAGQNWSEFEPMPRAVRFANDGTLWLMTFRELYRCSATASECASVAHPAFFPTALAIDSGDPKRLWLGSSQSGLFTSPDGGLNWSDVTPLDMPGIEVGRLEVAADGSGEVVAYFSRFASFIPPPLLRLSRDHGATWSDFSAGLPSAPILDLAHDGHRFLLGGGQLFANNGLGVWAGDTKVGSWVPLHDGGWPDLAITGIAVDPEQPNTLFAVSAQSGVHRSLDGGMTWHHGIGGSSAWPLNTVSVDRDRVILGAEGLGVLISDDGGATFIESNRGIRKLNVVSVAVNPLNSKQLAAAHKSLNSGGLVLSVDRGATWQRSSMPPADLLVIDYSPAGVLHAGLLPSDIVPAGVYRQGSDDSWTFLGPSGGNSINIGCMMWPARDAQVMIVGGFDGDSHRSAIWRSEDGGQRWHQVFRGGDSYEWVVGFANLGGDSLVAITSARSPSGKRDMDNKKQIADDSEPPRVLRSWDLGMTWTPLDHNLPSNVYPNGICVSAEDDGWMFLTSKTVGTDGEGVYISSNLGRSWTRSITGAAWSVACHPTDLRQIIVSQQPLFEYEPQISRIWFDESQYISFQHGMVRPNNMYSMVFMPETPRLLYGASWKGVWVTPLANPVRNPREPRRRGN